MNKSFHLSKSSFMRGVQCMKSLYLYKYHYDLQDEITESQQAIFDQGWEVGTLAQQRFPGGNNLQMDNSRDYGKAVRRTRELISEGHTIIYEAALEAHGVFCAVDILVRDKEGWRIYEVKSSTEVKEEHVLDSAVQYYVAESALKKMLDIGCWMLDKDKMLDARCSMPEKRCIEDVNIVFINNQYIRLGEIEVDKMFQIESVYERVLEAQEFVEEKLAKEVAMLCKEELPKVDIGPHCSDPYDCSFTGHCWKHVPEVSIFNISNLRSTKKWELYEEGVLEFKDIPLDYPLNEKQWQQVRTHLGDDVVHIEKKQISVFLEELIYPLWFLDFESINPAIPLYNGTRPYQQIPFQYSLHVGQVGQVGRVGQVRHVEFLTEADPDCDPREEFVKRLIKDIGQKGSILVYSIAFERTRLSELASAFPKYANELNLICDRMVDLCIPFRNRWYYRKEMKGLYSLKAVLPAVCPELSYDNLEVGEGSVASQYFLSMMHEKDPAKVGGMRRALLEYCKLDTWAMVKLLEVLMKI